MQRAGIEDIITIIIHTRADALRPRTTLETGVLPVRAERVRIPERLPDRWCPSVYVPVLQRVADAGNCTRTTELYLRSWIPSPVDSSQTMQCRKSDVRPGLHPGPSAEHAGAGRRYQTHREDQERSRCLNTRTLISTPKYWDADALSSQSADSLGWIAARPGPEQLQRLCATALTVDRTGSTPATSERSAS